MQILICDDHSLTRAGLISTLSNAPGIFIVGEAANGKEMIAQYEKLKPGLVIADIEMPGLSGIDALKQLILKHPHIKVLFDSVYRTGYLLLTNKIFLNAFLIKSNHD